MAKVLIRDGHTLDGCYPGDSNAGLPPVKFKYRRSIPDNTYEYLKKHDAAEPEKVGSVVRDLLKKHVVEWDVDAETGSGYAPINEDTLRQVPTPILNFMVAHVCSWKVSELREAEKNSPTAS